MQPASVPKLASARKVVLIIDDDAFIREAIADILAAEGIGCLATEDGAAGVALYGARRAEIGMVLLDLSMPGLSGEETCRRIKALDPDAPIVISSGYSNADLAERFAPLGTVDFLQKPYRWADLVARVRQVMS